ncbi:mitochondrial import inner membrane translocase subunit Tim54 [Astrocystis sublimbata]|nr:mitochondrial import inner membrane translocase subunit Tim54 [Astrocystis sublimbata]
MADAKPPPEAPPAVTAGAADPTASYKSSKGGNRALRMMGLPNLPKKLPSRNWLIFWTLAGSLSAAIIYDKREKKRATARWARAVSHLAKEPIASSTAMPRKLTIFLESPPTDGLRVAQDHFTEYIKPIIAASGLDWEFVQGRKEGDVRAAVAERIRRARDPAAAAASGAHTIDEAIAEVRRRNGTVEYNDIRGDIVIGRHTWKEYIRGLHEGWLGPLTAPPPPPPTAGIIQEPSTESTSTEETPKEGVDGEASEKPEDTKPKEEEKTKPSRPPQPPPYNTTADYPTATTPAIIPTEFSPSGPIEFPHILGFRYTFIRLGRFLTRRHLADDIGREVAAVCFAAARDFRNSEAIGDGSELAQTLDWEEGNWPKSVWKPEVQNDDDDEEEKARKNAEKIWTSPVVLDERIASRMRRFEITPDDEARARAIVVPEVEVEGFLKGSLRSLWRWAFTPTPRFQTPDVGDYDDE